MSGKVKNQHYVPRMYLNRFSADGKRICVWNLMKDNILTQQQPANYAAKRYFYDTSEQELKKALNEMGQVYPNSVENIDFSDEQFLEKALSRVEADAANIMDLISEKSEELYNEVNMQKMIIFLHELAYRSEKYRSTLADYENVKSIAAHATLLFNVLLLPIFGYIKIDVRRNMTNIIVSIFVMAAIGCYCNLVFRALASEAAAYDVNSMFLLHSPFEGLEFLTYPVIALIAIPIYFTVFVICDLCAHKKGAAFIIN